MKTGFAMVMVAVVTLAAPMAFAKAHDQGKGSTLSVEQTRNAAQGLGSALGAARGFNNVRG